MAHIWHYAFPLARRLSSHACRAHDVAAQTAEFLPEESGARCAAELLFDPKPKGESVEERRGEECGQGEPGVLMKYQRSIAAMIDVVCVISEAAVRCAFIDPFSLPLQLSVYPCLCYIIGVGLLGVRVRSRFLKKRPLDR